MSSGFQEQKEAEWLSTVVRNREGGEGMGKVGRCQTFVAGVAKYGVSEGHS